MTTEYKQGLIVTAKQTYYPIELSNSELLAHYETIQEYNQDILSNIVSQSCKFKPDPKLIDQQPELDPHTSRSITITFLFELSIMTRVTNGIFFQAVRLFDRYCSKRVVLKDQVKLVLATCLWLAAKTWGGCNHIINNVTVPTGGRFYGPNPRARIPRVSELVHYCGGSEVFDESMFMQMEGHILDTLNWDVYEPMINDYILNVDENCLIQYELYKSQAEYAEKLSQNRNSQLSQDSDATVDEEDEDSSMKDEDQELNSKIKLIELKKFLIDLSTWQYDLLKYELFEMSHGIFTMINRFTNQDQTPFLAFPIPSTNTQAQILNIFIKGICNVPHSLLEVYKGKDGIMQFISIVNEYQRKLEISSAMDLSRKNSFRSGYYDPQTIIACSPIYSRNGTPIRNVSASSDISVFSNIEQSSPLTPQMSGTYAQFKNESACGSVISVNSVTNHNINSMNKGSYTDCMDYNKENRIPNSLSQVPPRAKFINTGVFHSPTDTIHSGTNISDNSSLTSLGISNIYENVA
ncbi:hypothetical protein NCAS_0D04300 [Naumovozyma castellii]|uniref:G1/S-specific cyclin n=1 Tax=Naumovozyma castellii TaxID=27288 RepID=G0VEM0_NAUCA|nr:hypothetical protein NCAS_0D04300 [Naumovozyma castellii CBS 4309]CCC70011.1 hypothetical protein NCAS_0D04300 [Naumovozyma castellii CBS 4309]